MFLPVPTEITLNRFGKIYDKQEFVDLLTKKTAYLLNAEHLDAVVVAYVSVKSENSKGFIYAVFSVKDQKIVQSEQVTSYFLALKAKDFEVDVYFVPDARNKKQKAILTFDEYVSQTSRRLAT